MIRRSWPIHIGSRRNVNRSKLIYSMSATPCEPLGAHRGSTIAVDQSEHTQTELPTAIELNQAIVPARDKVPSPKFFARTLAFLSRNAQLDNSRRCALTIPALDFTDSNEIAIHHYAFKVSEEKFDAMFGRIKVEGIPYGNGPANPSTT